MKRLRAKTTATLLTILFLASVLSVVQVFGDGSTLSPPETPEMQGMVLELPSADGNILIEAFTWYRQTLDGDAGWHFRLVVQKVEGIDRADIGDELYAVWTNIEGVGWGFIVNSKSFNLHLKATGPRVGTYPYGDFYGHTSRYYKQPVVGRTYGKAVTGTLKQIYWEPAVPGEHPTYP